MAENSAYTINSPDTALMYQNGQAYDLSNGADYMAALQNRTFLPWNRPKVAREAIANIQAQAYNSAEAQRQRDWQTDLSNTAHQREVADLQAAGLNTWLSADGSGASTPSGASGHASNSAAAAGSQAAPVFNGIMQVLQLAAAFKGIGANETRAAASMLSATANQEKAKAASMSAAKAMDGQTKADLAAQRLKLQETEIASKVAARAAATAQKNEDLELKRKAHELKTFIAKDHKTRSDVLAAGKMADMLSNKETKKSYFDADGTLTHSDHAYQFGATANDVADLLGLFNFKG